MGTLAPRTGGDIYQENIRRYLLANGWKIEFVALHELREQTRNDLSNALSWLPNWLLAMLTAIKIFRHVWPVRGLIVQDQDYSIALLPLNLLTVLLRRGSILTVVHHFPDYESSAPASLQKRLRLWKHKLALWPSEQFVTVSQYSKREIVSLGIDPGHITIIPPGVDRDNLEIHPKSKDDTVHIITLGNVASRKGTIHLVEAFAKLARPNTRLHIVGAPAWEHDSYFEMVKQAAKESGVADRTHFHGRLEQKHVNRLLSQADIFAMPSLQEGFGIALLEAMHFGLPVITTNVTALPELVEDGVNGLLVPPADPSALAQALLRLVDTPALRQTLGKAGRQRVEGRYDWTTTGHKFEQLMQRMLAKQQ
jgi:glycosyltransferase involved in cell wall biosynthesis